jgi:sugar lactone lactonase YvrE
MARGGFLYRLAVLTCLVALSACGGGNAVSPGFLSPPNDTGWHPSSSGTNLYVENFQGIVEYTLDGHRIRDVRKGFTQKGGTRTGGLAFDPSGYLYAITGDFSVSVYAPVSRKLVRILTTGIGWPFAITTDAQGNLYVGNGETNTVAVFASGASSPSRTISSGIADPASLAIDSKGNLYVANLFGDSITVYRPDGTLLRTITAGAIGPEALAINANDELYVGDAYAGYGNTATVYAPPRDRLVQTITQGVRAPWSIGVDSRSRLYLANANAGTVTVYSPRTFKLQRTISLDAEPGSLAFDAADDLYVAAYAVPSSVKVFAPGSNSPKLVITKGITTPLTLAIGPP